VHAKVEPSGAAATHSFRLPLVSVIVINFNYGRYLREAVRSVLTQTYPEIECIIVDNASTDESAIVLDELARQHSGVIILRRPDNAGMCAAAVEGFEASSGQYVIFLDADDILLGEAAATHVFVHLSLRTPVGATSADMLQAVEDRLAVSTLQSAFDFAEGRKPERFRRFDEAAPSLWPLPAPDAGLADQIRFVEPLQADWVWSATSGNCFRRDALRIFLTKEGIGSLRGCLDNYLLCAISVMTGSVLIDRPLAVYRIHGKNLFTQRPSLNNLNSFSRGDDEDELKAARGAVIEHLIANAAFFLSRLPWPPFLMQALEALNDAWPQLAPAPERYKAYLARPEFAAITAAIGIEPQSGWLTRLGMPGEEIRRAIRTDRSRRPSAR
jgi:glycosyltransferase involved in cell wall biosynthesis